MAGFQLTEEQLAMLQEHRRVVGEAVADTPDLALSRTEDQRTVMVFQGNQLMGVVHETIQGDFVTVRQGGSARVLRSSYAIDDWVTRCDIED
jgi:hypothetical protein